MFNRDERHQGHVITVRYEGYGFIEECDTGEKYYFHATSVKGNLFRKLWNGCKVDFALIRHSSKGLEAVDIFCEILENTKTQDVVV